MEGFNADYEVARWRAWLPGVHNEAAEVRCMRLRRGRYRLPRLYRHEPERGIVRCPFMGGIQADAAKCRLNNAFERLVTRCTPARVRRAAILRRPRA